ncbi:MAG: ribosomal protein L7/L12 [Planctomycetales bacterium]
MPVTSGDALRILFRSCWRGLVAVVLFGILVVAPLKAILGSAGVNEDQALFVMIPLAVVMVCLAIAAFAEAIANTLGVSFGQGVQIFLVTQLPSLCLTGISLAVNGIPTRGDLPNQTVGGARQQAQQQADQQQGGQRLIAPVVSDAVVIPGENWQKGEPLLSEQEVNLSAPLHRHANSPWIRLSNLRQAAPNWQKVMVDYQREGTLDPESKIFLVVNQARQQVQSRIPVLLRTGTFREDDSPSATNRDPSSEPVEVWLEQEDEYDGATLRTKVSNSVISSGSPQHLARQWRKSEYEHLQRVLARPKAPRQDPPGFSPVSNVGQLFPGLPVQCYTPSGRRNLEVVDTHRTDGRSVLIGANLNDPSRRVLYEAEPSELAARESDLTAGKEKFQPALHVLPGGSCPVPENFAVVDSMMPLLKGTPLLAETNGAWRDATATESSSAEKVQVRFDSGLEQLQPVTYSRSQLLISPQTLELLKSPDAADRLAERANVVAKGVKVVPFPVSPHSQYLRVPLNATRVEADTPLKSGTKVSVCVRSDWAEATVMSVKPEDPSQVVIHISSPDAADFPYSEVSREHLIISQYELAKLKSKKSAELADAAKAPPTAGFSNSSGDAAPALPKSESDVPDASSEKKSLQGGWVAILPSTKLVKGVPVKAENSYKSWEDATIIDLIDDDSVQIKWDRNLSRSEVRMTRSSLMMTPKVAEALKKPDAAELFATRAERAIHSIPTRTYPKAVFSIRIPIPNKAVKVTKETPLRPGVPCGMNYNGQWYDVSIVEKNWDDTFRIHINRLGQDYDGDIDPECLIIEKQVLARLGSGDGASKVAGTSSAGKKDDAPRSMLEPRGGDKKGSTSVSTPKAGPPVIDKLVPVDEDTPLVRGTPVKMEDRSGNLEDATISEIIDTDRVLVLRDSWGRSRPEEAKRSSLRIRTRALDALGKPDAEAKFALRLERIQNAVRTQAYPRSEFSIRIPLPNNGVKVTKETPLEPGTQVGLNAGGRWIGATVVDINWDDTIRIHVNAARGDYYDGDIERECLIIDKKVLAQLKSRHPGGATPTPPEEETGSPSAPANSPVTKGNGKFQVVLKSYGSKKIPVTLVVGKATGMELKDAMKLVMKAPVEIKKDLDKESAEKLRKDLEDAGATVELKPQ